LPRWVVLRQKKEAFTPWQISVLGLRIPDDQAMLRCEPYDRRRKLHIAGEEAMGASEWEYVVPYQPDLGAALDALRRQVFASGEYVKPGSYGDVFDLPEPRSVDDLTEQEQYWEFMGTSGTHSIIDVLNVVPADFTGEEFATIRPLSDAECAELFGTTQPSRADYTSLAGSQRLHEYVTGGRWTGRAAVLWAEGTPADIAFWGYSGD
jgi:hypothetical protein